MSLPRYTEIPRTPMKAIPTARLVESRRAYALARTFVRQRSGDVCEICRGARATETQHRIRRGQGGSSRNPEIHRVSALLHLCQTCHHDADNHPDRYVFGWSVRREHDVDTTTVPVLLGTQWFLLDDEGGRRAAPDGGDTDASGRARLRPVLPRLPLRGMQNGEGHLHGGAAPVRSRDRAALDDIHTRAADLERARRRSIHRSRREPRLPVRLRGARLPLSPVYRGALGTRPHPQGAETTPAGRPLTWWRGPAGEAGVAPPPHHRPPDAKTSTTEIPMSDTDTTTEITMDAGGLHAGIRNALLFTSDDEYAPPLQGIWMEWDGASLTATATDRFTLGRATFAGVIVNRAGESWAMLLMIPAAKAVLGMLRAALSENSARLVRCTVSGTELALSTDGMRFAVTLVKPTFPPPYRTLLARAVPDLTSGEVAISSHILKPFLRVSSNYSSPIRFAVTGATDPVYVRIGEHFTGLLMPVKTPDVEAAELARKVKENSGSAA